MKKIGIVTFHRAHNYGAFLQVYALQEKVKELNNDVEVVDYYNDTIYRQYEYKYICTDNIKRKRYYLFNNIINEKLNLSKRYNNLEELKNANMDYDILITGSDQVWNPNIVGELSDAYTLNFGSEKTKRISYAASMGNSKIEDKYKSDYKSKIEKIDSISVREEVAKKELSKIIDNNIEVVLDPTLLLKKEKWEKEISNSKEDVNEKYILAYVVEPDEEYNKIVNELSEKTGLKIVHFQKKNKKLINVLKCCFNTNPFEFIKLIKDAEYVIATSFHATVFSIIFNKKFWIIPHRQTGSRVINLLEKFKISNRIVNNIEEFKEKNYDENIDYSQVNRILEEEREKSIAWLNNAINN